MRPRKADGKAGQAQLRRYLSALARDPASQPCLPWDPHGPAHPLLSQDLEVLLFGGCEGGLPFTVFAAGLETCGLFL